ncbi:MAG: PAS domain S-box protein [Anaerolineales bacterium]|nr:PAS domain S-box protein [Anaerolineales bacterium]
MASKRTGLGNIIAPPKNQWSRILTVFFIINAAGNWSSGNTLAVSFGFALANILEPLLSAWVITYFCKSKISFTKLREVFTLFAAVICVNGITALLGAAIPAMAFGAPFIKTWQLWWTADGLGMVLLTPFIVTMVNRPTDIRSVAPRSILEGVLLLSLILSFAWLLFGPFTDAENPLLRNYMVFPFLIWLAFRFEVHGTTGTLILFAGIAIGHTLQDQGIFAIENQTISQHLISLQLFLFTAAFSGLFLCVLVAEHIQGAKKLGDSERKYRELFDKAILAIFQSTLDGKVIIVNPAFAKMFGYESPQAVLANIKDISLELFADPQRRSEIIRLRKENPQLNTFENLYRRKDGSTFTGRLYISTLYGADGQAKAFEGFIEDITERQRMEEELRMSEVNFRNLAESTPDGILIGTASGRHIYVNGHAAKILGYTPDELLQTTQKDLADPAAYPLLKQRLADRLAGKPLPSTYETVIRRKDGTSLPVEISGTKTIWQGQATDLVFFRDITERKRAEQELRRSEEQYRTMFENMTQGVFYQQADGQLIDVNHAALEMFGLEREEFLGKTSHDPYWKVFAENGEELKAADHPSMRALITGKVVRNSIARVYRNRQGDFVWMSINAIPQFKPNESQPYQVFVTIEDITERKQIEAIQQTRLLLSQSADSHSLDEIMQMTLDKAEALTGSQIGFAHFLEADQKTLLLQMWSSNTLKNMCSAEGKGQHYSVDKAGVWVDCIATREAVIHNDYASLTHRKGLPAGHAPIQRELVVPVLRNDSIVMIMGVGNKPTDFNDNDVRIVEQLASLAWDIVQRKRAEEALRENIELFSLFMRYSPVYTFIKTVTPTESRVVQASDNYQEMLGISGVDMIGKSMEELFPPEFAAKISADDWSVVSKEEVLKLDEELNGRQYTTIKFPISQGNKTLLAGYTIDVTERVQAESALRDSELFVKDILNSLTAHIAVLNERGVIVAVNEAWRKFARENDSADSADYLGANYLTACEAATRQGDPISRQVEQAIRAVMTGTLDQFITEYPCHSPTQQRWFTVTILPQHNSRPGTVIIHQEITERKRSEQLLEAVNLALQTSLVREQELARIDPLTGINNRRCLLESAEHEFEVAARYQRPLTVLMFDVDHFKKVNDTFGHAVGDQMLQEVTRIAGRELRTADILGRYGGEEFIIILPMTRSEQAYALAERIREGVAAIALPTPKGDVCVTLSIGIVEISPAETVEDAFRRADQAMYDAKQKGRNRTEIGKSDALRKNKDRSL